MPHNLILWIVQNGFLNRRATGRIFSESPQTFETKKYRLWILKSVTAWPYALWRKVETIAYGEIFRKISWKHCKNMINCSLISTAGGVFLLKFICFCVFFITKNNAFLTAFSSKIPQNSRLRRGTLFVIPNTVFPYGEIFSSILGLWGKFRQTTPPPQGGYQGPLVGSPNFPIRQLFQHIFSHKAYV